MIYSRLSLPPKVIGHYQGLLVFSFRDLSFIGNIDEQTCCIRISWWGSDDVDIVKLSPTSDSTIAYRLCGNIKTYLEDMSSIQIQVLANESPSSQILGTVSVDIANIVYGTKVDHSPTSFVTKPVVTGSSSDDAKIGSLKLNLSLFPSPSTTLNIPPMNKSAPQYEQLSPKQNTDDTNPMPSTLEGSSLLQPKSPPHNNPHTNDEEEDYILKLSINSAFQLPEAAQPTTSSHHMSSEEALGISFVYCSVSTTTTPPSISSTSTTTTAAAPPPSGSTSIMNTHLAAVHEVPPVGRSVVWNAHMNIPIHISKNPASLPSLSLHLWHAGGPQKDPGTLLQAMALGKGREAAVQSPYDTLIGCAVLDLHALFSRDALFSKDKVRHGTITKQNSSADDKNMKENMKDNIYSIEDRYPLVNACYNVQGLIKIRMEPNKALQSFFDEMNCCYLDNEEKHYDASIEKTNTNTRAFPPEKKGVLLTAGTVHKESKKIQYAWSGSDDSDDDFPYVAGMTLEGAVSCSDEEIPQKESDSLLEKRKKDSLDTAPQLVDDDWLFDIAKQPTACPVVAKDGGIDCVANIEEIKTSMHGGGEENNDDTDGIDKGDNDGVSNVSEDLSSAKEKKGGIKFKNSLLPGVVYIDTTYVATPSSVDTLALPHTSIPNSSTSLHSTLLNSTTTTAAENISQGVSALPAEIIPKVSPEGQHQPGIHPKTSPIDTTTMATTTTTMAPTTTTRAPTTSAAPSKNIHFKGFDMSTWMFDIHKNNPSQQHPSTNGTLSSAKSNNNKEWVVVGNQFEPMKK